VLAQSAEEVEVLITRGDDPNRKDKNGDTPLHHHASSLAGTSPAIVKALLDAGAVPTTQNKRLQTALHLAKTTSMVQVILEGGGDPFEIMDEDGRTAFEAQSPEIREYILNEVSSSVTPKSTSE